MSVSTGMMAQGGSGLGSPGAIAAPQGDGPGSTTIGYQISKVGANVTIEHAQARDEHRTEIVEDLRASALLWVGA